MSEIIVKVKAELESKGYSGLYCDGECACEVDDLAPCGEHDLLDGEGFINGCEPGHKHIDPKDKTFWVVSRSSEPPTEGQWERYRQEYEA